ncbi:MAG: ribulose-phosphate 3-epimerase [Spirochaetes bacterium]|nr:ribulose-phosphate 3-epimerase [Spirochaetota bacterium]
MPTISNKVIISPSIIAGDLSTIGTDVKTYNSDIIDILHMDVMDGNFVPNLTFGPGFIKNLQKHTKIPIDIHLMIEKPENSLKQYMELNPKYITLHYESAKFHTRYLNLIKENGINAGLALNPSTPIDAVFDLIEFCDIILIMSVDPGFYGQPFIKQSLSKIGRLKEHLLLNNFNNVKIQVDGGINEKNIKDVVSAGADIVVAGNSLYKEGEINENALKLKKIAAS